MLNSASYHTESMSSQMKDIFRCCLIAIAICICGPGGFAGSANTPEGREERAKRRQKWREAKQSERAAWYRCLPEQRCALDSFDPATMKNVSRQQQSTLFGKLPLELRQLIYGYALSGEQLEIEVTNPWPAKAHTLDAVPPQGKRGLHFRHDYTKQTFQLKCPKLHKLQAFPFTCKMAFMEARDIVLRSNTFYFLDTAAYLCFQRLASNYTVHTIESIGLRWSHPESYYTAMFFHCIPPGDRTSWQQTWDKIGKMRGLKNVRLDMVMPASWQDPDYENLLLSPVAAASYIHQKTIEVRTSWTGEAITVWPFDIHREVLEPC